MKYFKVLLIIIFIFSFSYSETAVNDNSRPKIGLVLSGGGALGVAHIGILKVIDSLNIPIDYIAGTSMGGIAGGLYALGYKGHDLEQLIQTLDWIDIFNDMPDRNLRSHFQKKDDGKYQFDFGISKGSIFVPSGLIHGQKISMLLANLTNQFEQIENFDDLPIPFRCVAVDLITGNEVILKEGSISKALRSTMSIPSAFNPVQWGDSLLIDGGLLNNLPVDVVKEMGADIVIGVNVSLSTNPTANLNSAVGILERSITIPASNRSNQNISNIDVYVEPELSGYTGTDFTNRKVKRILEIGKNAANEAIPDLLRICEENKIQLETAKFYEPKIIRNIYIGGNKVKSAQHLRNKLNIFQGDTLNISILEGRIASIKLSENLKNVAYEFVDVDNNEVDILLNIEENIIPTIYRISVRGNKTIPFSFIYRFIGINPTDSFDINLLNQRIDELYGLGYFETISYEIEPIEPNSIHLIFVIKEASQSLLRLGFTYDETSKFIGTANIVSTRVLIPGLRFEGTMRFAGLFDFRAKLYYPFRANDISIYPFIQTYHKNIPTDIFGTTGSKIARYNDRSLSWSTGIGFLSSKNWSTEIEYNNEYMDVTPEVAYPDSSQFPSWDDKISSIRLNTIHDSRDDVNIPMKGLLINFHYEGSSSILNTDVTYNKFELNIDYYKSFGNKHTLRIFSQFGISNDDLPTYKWFFYGGPNRLVGADKYELSYYRTSIFGIDYRFKLIDNLYFKTLYNIVPNYNGDFYPIESENIHGYGIGLKYNTILGPIELIISQGNKITTDKTSQMKNVFYLRFGYNLPY